MTKITTIKELRNKRILREAMNRPSHLIAEKLLERACGPAGASDEQAQEARRRITVKQGGRR